jgi:hypothetical protein
MSTHNAQLITFPSRPLLRTNTRYAIDASCRFWWTTLAEQANFGGGRITDISVSGVSIRSSILPLVGSSVMLEIDLPRSPRSTQSDDSSLLLTAEGRVLRHHLNGQGFAASITHSSFSSFQETLAD